MIYIEDPEKVSRLLFPFYLSILAFSTIPMGSNRPWAWSILAVAAFSVLAYYLMQYARSALRPPLLSQRVKIILILSCLWLFYQALQLLPLPIEFIRLISTNTVALKDTGISTLEYVTLNISYKDGLHELVKSSLYVTMFILTILLVQSRDKMRVLLLTVVALGVLQALWGLVSAFLVHSTISGVSVAAEVDQFAGTFISKNHFAAFINISIAAIIGLLLSVGVTENRQIHREEHAHYWQSRLFDWRVHLIFYLTLLLFALYFSSSLGAWMAFIAMPCIIVAYAFMEKTYKWIFIFGFLGFAFFVLEQFSVNYDVYNTMFNGRLDIWTSCYSIFKDYWLTGTGGGSFRYIYPLYDSGKLLAKVEHAHNDYLEILIEQGVIGASLICLVVLLCLKNSLSYIFQSKSVRQSAFAIASVLGISGMLVHSLADFNFHIPSNSMYFFVYLGLASVQGLKSLKPEKREAVWDEVLFAKER